MDRPRLVGAVFSETDAERAASELERQDLAGRRLVSAVHDDQRFVIEPDAGSSLRAGLVRGAIFGALVGAVVGFVFLLIVTQETSLAFDLLVGGGVGALGGAVYGAYLGMSRHRPRLWNQQDWEHVSARTGDVLLVVDAGDRSEQAADILTSNGGRLVEPVHPG